MKFATHGLVLLVLASLLFLGCLGKSESDAFPVLRVGWWNSERERYAYVVRPRQSNLTEVAVITREAMLEGPLLKRSLEELLLLAETAHKQASELPTIPPPAAAVQLRRVVVNYGTNGKKSFSVEGAVPELLKAIRRAPALEQLLVLLSRDQPKSYRILDDPTASGQFMKPPSEGGN